MNSNCVEHDQEGLNLSIYMYMKEELFQPTFWYILGVDLRKPYKVHNYIRECRPCLHL